MRWGSTNLEPHIRYFRSRNTALKCTATLDLYLCMISHIHMICMYQLQKNVILIGFSTAVVKHRIKEITRFYLIEIIKIEK